MSKTVKLLNEGFEQKYMEKEIFHNDNGTDYDVIERSKSGQNALLNNGNQWIIAWNCPEDNKGSWGQGHYFFDEESARDAWERNYLSEAFDTNDDTVEAVCKECGTKGYAHKHTADENGEFTCSSCKKLHEDSTFDKSKAQKMFKKLRDLDDDGEGEKKDDLSFALKNANKTKHPLLIETPPVVGTLARIKAWCKMNGLKPVYITKENPSLNKEVSSDTAIIVPDFDKMDARTRLAFESTMDKNNAGLVVAIVNSDSNLDAAERNMFTVLTVLDGEIFRDKYEKHTARMGANESLKKRIKECLSRLNEAEMSPEDKADSKILWDIYNKTQNRKNAKLTPEENAVLDKYGLVRNSDWQTISKKGGQYSYGPEVTNRDITRKFSWNNPDFRRSYKSSTDVQSKINLADRARKMDVRGAGGYEHSLNYDNNWDFTDDGDWSDDPEHLDYIDPKTGEVAGLKSTKNNPRYNDYTDYYNTIAGKERAKLNHEMTKNVQNMKQSLRDRKYYQRELDNNDAEYDSYKAKIQQEYDDATARYNQRLASNEEQRRYSAKNARAGLDNTNAEINKLLKRKDESMLPEDFNEKNLDKRGTMEYEANKKRANRINMYRKFANLTEGEEITEENIDERALNRTACFSNREPERVRAEILGQRYSDYEI